MSAHRKYLQRCIDLAKLGAGYVSPNPMVGAVIVCDDVVIGEGYHQRYGEAHAEVNAVNNVLSKCSSAADLLQRSTLYVSLEPCAHYGKTPPCADLVIKHRIPKVVVGCRDPFDQVNGKGIEKLQAAGIEVITGIMDQECLDLNKRFFTHVQKQRPYIILKWARTADGYFAPNNGSRFWITGPESKKLVHKWRAEEDAVLVGKHTAAIDDPQLNVRDWQGRSPKRVVIDRKLELSTGLHLFDQSVDTFVFNEVKTDVDGKVKYISLEDFDNFVPQYIMFQLYLQDIRSVIIEGGATTLKAFIDAGLWDEARIFTGYKHLKNGIPSPDVNGVIKNTCQVGDDTLQVIYNS